MRGADITQEPLFTVAKLDDFVPADYPVRAVRTLADTALKRLDGLFGAMRWNPPLLCASSARDE